MNTFLSALRFAERPSIFVALFLVIAASYVFSTQPANADEKINLDTLSGNISIQRDDGSWSDILPSKIDLPLAIKTGEKSKAVVSQGGTSITISANTEIEISNSETRQGNIISLIKQRLGNAIYKVEKHPGDFTVETPYLVSVVKGTRFSVFTDNSNSFVSVTEGLVEVNDLLTGEVQDLGAGEIAKSTANDIAQHARSLILHSAAVNQSTAADENAYDQEEVAGLAEEAVKPKKAQSKARNSKSRMRSEEIRSSKPHANENQRIKSIAQSMKTDTLDNSRNQNSPINGFQALNEVSTLQDEKRRFPVLLENDPDRQKEYINEIDSRINDIVDNGSLEDIVPNACLHANQNAINNAAPGSVLSYCN